MGEKHFYIAPRPKMCYNKLKKGGGDMKKILLALAFAISYAIFLSVGLECLLHLSAMAMAISLDGPPVTKQYPRFIPFCLVVGILVVAALVGIFILNFKASEKYDFTKKIWWTQMIIATLISISMIKPWEMLFEFLQKVF